MFIGATSLATSEIQRMRDDRRNFMIFVANRSQYVGLGPIIDRSTWQHAAVKQTWDVICAQLLRKYFIMLAQFVETNSLKYQLRHR